jgi:hypothetical protein
MKNLELIKGTDLTEEQKNLLDFKGMQNQEWINSHSFYFIDDKPASRDSGYFYPVINSLSFLPY